MQLIITILWFCALVHTGLLIVMLMIITLRIDHLLLEHYYRGGERPNDPQPLGCTYIWADCSGISFSIPIQTGPIDYEEFPDFIEGE